jgi:catechol 2,3-dioxygenase-like lactoylglutathione lyase family enzyme
MTLGNAHEMIRSWRQVFRHEPRVIVSRGRSILVKVKRVVANVAVSDPAVAKRFYQDLLGLEVVMDLGWIATYGSREKMPVQISFLSEGGSGAPVPDVSIEVDDIDAAFSRMTKAKVPIEYGPADEPWGVRRFFVRDPFGTLVNIVSHVG